MARCAICNDTGQYKGINLAGKEAILFCGCPNLPAGEKWGWRSRCGCLGNTYELPPDTPDSAMPPVNIVKAKPAPAKKVFEHEQPKEKVLRTVEI
jgi:hypothetical protein